MSRYSHALILVVLTGLTLSTAAPALAQQPDATQAQLDASQVTSSLFNLTALTRTEDQSSGPATSASPQAQTPAVFSPITYMPPKAPSWFTAFHVMTAGLQAADAMTTLSGLKSGAVEVNPLVAPLAKNRGALIATKAAVAAGIIYATHSMSKRHRVAAVVAAVAVNGAYAAIVAHNYRTLHRIP